MTPLTVGKKFYTGQTAHIKCVKNDDLQNVNIKDNSFLLLMVYDGNAYFKLGDKTFEAVGPCFVCFDEREQPRLVRSGGLKCDSIYFLPQFLNENITLEQVHSECYNRLTFVHDMLMMEPFTSEKRFVFPMFEDDINRLKRLFGALQKELEGQADMYWPSRARSCFVEIIRILEKMYGISENDFSISQASKIKNPHLRRAIIYIESHYYEDISLDSVSQAASINHSSLTGIFKEELGITPIEYLWWYRLKVSKRLLAFTNLMIMDVAKRCGFKTLSHFSRKFEGHTGCTPTDYRKRRSLERKSEIE